MSMNWSAYSVRDLNEIIRADNVCSGSDQVNAWERMETALRTQRQRLERIRETVLTTWSPTTSEAAAAFADYVSGLVDQMSTAEVRAANNAVALSGILDAIREAQVKLGDLASQYEDKANDLMLRTFDHAEDELNRQAQAVMADTETSVVGWSTMLRPHDDVQLVGNFEPGTPIGPPEGVGAGSGASGADANVLGSSAGDRHVPPISYDPLPPSKGGASPDGELGAPANPGAGGSHAGPVLAGGPTPAPSGSNGVLPPPSAVPAPVPVGGLPSPAGPGGLPSVPPMGMVPGGVIGGPMTGRGGSGSRGAAGGAGRAPTGRAMPSGMVIGQPPTGRGPVGGRGGAIGRGGRNTVLPAQALRDRPHRDGNEALPPFDPDNPWAVEEGVPPVITSDHRPERHDPGPGVIGMRP